MGKKHRITGKPQGATYADVLARKQQLRASVDKAAHDTMVQVEADIRTQRAMWLMVCSIADAYGFGPKRIQQFFEAFQANTDEMERMTTEVDSDYAYEKLRHRAQQVTGMEVGYLYEAEMRAAKNRYGAETAQALHGQSEPEEGEMIDPKPHPLV